ncbi:MAG: dodecin domain-containing protein [Caldilineales bacterium]|nr:dodecin domain-containing protein [Caldilineales bacterium]
MPNPVYKHIRVTGTSTVSLEDAVNNAIGRAGSTVRQMRWFSVLETRGSIHNNQVQQWQVTIEIGFALEDESAD